jgi:hypothetical protein
MTDQPETNNTKNTMTRYLLGDMSEPERAVFEDHYLNDPDTFHQLVEVENDLIDLYTLRELSSEQARRVEVALLARPEGPYRLAFAERLANYPENTTLETQQSSWRPSRETVLRLSTTFVLAAMTAGIAWLLVAYHLLKNEMEALRMQQATASQQAESLAKRVDSLSIIRKNQAIEEQMAPPGLDKTVVSFVLTADSTRGNADEQELAIPRSAAFVALRLVFPSDSASSLDLSLETAEGTPVWSKKHFPGKPAGPGNQEVSVRLSSGILRSGDYVLRVSRTFNGQSTDIAGYSFRVVRR